MNRIMLAAALAAAVGATPVRAGAHGSSSGWDGAYVGFTAGGSEMKADTARVITNNTYWSQPNQDAVEAASLVSFTEDGFLAGVTAGYNWDLNWSSVIFGVEGDFNFNSIEASSSVTTPYPSNNATNFTTTTALDQDWLATVRARFGFDVAGSLIYATGGLALADVTFTQTFRDTVQPIPFTALSTQDVRAGWTAGGGIEVPVFADTTLKIEYLYVDLGSDDLTGSTLGTTVPTTTQVGTADLTYNVVRAGMNWRF